MPNKSKIQILLISYYFAPGNLMGAVRPTKLAKYFKREGYDLNVIASKENRWLFLNNEIKIDQTLLADSNNLNIYRPTHSWLFKFFAYFVKRIMNTFITTSKKKSPNLESNNNKNHLGFKHYFTKNAMFFMALLQDIDFTICAILSKKVRKLAKESSHILSSYGPYSSHFLAYAIKSIYGNKISWIADFRDPIAQPTDTKIQFYINKWIENKVCNKANQLVSVSNGYMQSIVKAKFYDKSTVITNGFDKEDLHFIQTNNLLSNKFIISYTGTTYGGRRDLKPIFRVIKELEIDNFTNIDLLEFHYAGPESELVKELGIRFEIDNKIHTFGNVSRNESIRLNNNSSLIVVATWNDKSHLGVLPGKFFESLLFNKPLLVLVSGEIRESEIVNITKELELGITYEEANKDIDYIKLKEFIKSKLLISNNFVDTKTTSINKFEYQFIAREYLKLINK